MATLVFAVAGFVAAVTPAHAWDRYRCSPDTGSGRAAESGDWPAFVGDRVVTGASGYTAMLTRADGFRTFVPCEGRPREAPGLHCGGTLIRFDLDTLTLRYSLEVTEAGQPDLGPAFEEVGSCLLLKHKRVTPDGFLWG